MCIHSMCMHRGPGTYRTKAPRAPAVCARCTDKYHRAFVGVFELCNFSYMTAYAVRIHSGIPLELARARYVIRTEGKRAADSSCGGSCRSNYCNEILLAKRTRRMPAGGSLGNEAAPKPLTESAPVFGSSWCFPGRNGMLRWSSLRNGLRL